MDRIRSEPRLDWEKTVESQGFHFHSLDDEPYWDESAYYRFSASQIDVLEKATYELDRMCVAAAGHVIENEQFDHFNIPDWFRPYLTQSWEHDEFTLYGRFDLAFDGTNPPKLLEYNADTPTALLEAAVIQWYWLKDVHPQLDQFNSIHERLIEAWKTQAPQMTGFVHFSALRGNLEDFMTVNYLRDTAIQAGLQTTYINVEDIGWNTARGVFTDIAERAMETMFKLYPWEWLLTDEFGPQIPRAPTRWLEPAWKIILSNKAILPVLYELYPDSPFLLPAGYEPLAGTCIRKPCQSREGANVAVLQNGTVESETEGPYDGPSIYQQRAQLRAFEGNYPVIGSWIVNGYACGIGIREDTSPITQNTSRFVPHVFSGSS